MTTFDLRRVGAAAVLVSALLVAPALPAAASVVAAPGRPYTVTLVTGDRVTVASAAATRGSVEPGPGREHVSFVTSVVHGHLLVIPSDAARLVQVKRLDQRLFDVTALIGLGYDDRARTTVPLIMGDRTAAGLAEVKREVSARGARTTRDLRAVKAVAVTAPKASTAALWKSIIAAGDDPDRRVWLDGKRERLLDVSVPQIGAPAAWQAGLTGRGVSVAVLDTGVDATHPDLAGRVVERNFSSAPDGDQDGHGTHVASTIAGDGTASAGRYRGVAPEATVLSGKVCEEFFCTDSAILAGMQWAAVDEHARVISMSLGGRDLPSTDPLEEAVNALTAQTGALFVIAAGNSGSSAGTVESPGSADAALTVGAVDKSDVMAEFSSRGPRAGDGAIKPDIAAPGVNIVAALAKGVTMGTPPADFPDSYTAISGTSMATPHVAGAAVLLAQKRPEWKAGQLKSTLMGAAERTADGGVLDKGAGRVDVARAIDQTVTADPPSLSFGLQKWPHDNDTALTKTVTYRNTGAEAVTYQLELTAAPAFTLSASRVEIPAGGTAEVTVTADTRQLAPGTYTAYLIATAGPARVVTAVAVQKEDERYEVTLRHLGLDGKPSPNYFTQIIGISDDSFFDVPYDPSGTVTLRLPKGRYATATYLELSDSPETSQQALIYQPILDVDRDTTATFDARETSAVKQSVPEATAEAGDVFFGVELRVDDQPLGFGTLQAGFRNARVGELGQHVAGSGWVTSAWAKRGSGDDSINSPYTYFVGEVVPVDALLSGYDRAFQRGELATVTHRVRNYAPGQRAMQFDEFIDEDGNSVALGRFAMRAPGSRTSYYSTGPGFVPQPTMQIGTWPDYLLDGVQLTGEPHALRAGSRSVEEWGAAPFTPAFNSSQPEWISLRDGTLLALVFPVGDAAGHVGFGTTQSVTTRLFRDDQLLDETEGVFVGADGLADGGIYRIEQEAGSLGRLATSTRSVFTFRDPAKVFTVRAAPRLDADDAVPSGTTRRVPLTALNQAGDPVRVQRLGLDVSFDDGKTWKPATVSGGFATVRHPAGRGFVSLRVHGTDTGETETTQTVIRAYRYR
ncbi:MAG: S8 family serine peptidase [Actinoplanes sp.]